MPIAVGTEPQPAALLNVKINKSAGEAPSLDTLSGGLPAMVDTTALDTASKILHIIDRYRMKRSPDAPAKADEGALKFLAVIYSHVRAGEVVPMCLPAFPFKSPNTSVKVLGKLPDRAEELALAHLNGLCKAIADVYPPGAKLTIISDGLVYNGMSSTPTTHSVATSVADLSRPAWRPRQRCLGVRRDPPGLGRGKGLRQHRLLPSQGPRLDRPAGAARRDDICRQRLQLPPRAPQHL